MLTLPQVTIVAIDCVTPAEAVKALRYSMRGIKFKEAVLFTTDPIQDPRHSMYLPDIRLVGIPKLDLNGYSDFCLRLSQYIDSDYVLIIQKDGFVTNPEMWSPEFLKYDYIGAAWSNEESWIEKQTAKAYIRDVFSQNRVGNGGFSLRSRKFLEVSSHFKNCGGYGEDCFLCTINYHYMVAQGIKFAPLQLSYNFSYENPLAEFGNEYRLDPMAHFGFHGHQFHNSEEVINSKNV